MLRFQLSRGVCADASGLRTHFAASPAVKLYEAFRWQVLELKENSAFSSSGIYVCKRSEECAIRNLQVKTHFAARLAAGVQFPASLTTAVPLESDSTVLKEALFQE